MGTDCMNLYFVEITLHITQASLSIIIYCIQFCTAGYLSRCGSQACNRLTQCLVQQQLLTDLRKSLFLNLVTRMWYSDHLELLTTNSIITYLNCMDFEGKHIMYCKAELQICSHIYRRKQITPKKLHTEQVLNHMNNASDFK